MTLDNRYNKLSVQRLKNIPIYDMDWQSRNNKAFVKVLTVKDNIKKIAEVPIPFLPYMFISEQRWKQTQEPLLKIMASVGCGSIKPFDGYYQHKTKMAIVEMVRPDLIGKFRDKSITNEIPMRTFEADKPYKTRVMIDLGLTIGEPTLELFWDIEVDPRNGFPSPKEAKEKILSMTIVDKEGNITYFRDNDEIKMIRSFLNFIKPYIFLEGWNIKFDEEYLKNRCEKLGIQVDWFGYIFIDALTVLKDFLEIKMDCGWHLPDVMKKLFNWDMDDAARKGEIKTFVNDEERLKNKNITDALAVKKLNEYYDYMTVYMRLLRETLTLPNAYPTRYQCIENLLMHYGSQRVPRVIFPNRFAKKGESDEVVAMDYSGAFVSETIPGLHSWVLGLDYRNMYGNIMITFNIGWDSWVAEDEKGVKIFNRKYSIPSLYKSIFAELVEKKTWLREEYKAEMAKCMLGSPEYEKWASYDYAMKILLVATPGVLGYPSSRFYDPAVVEDITKMGQKLIRTAIDKAKKMGWYHIFAHTDGAFIRHPNIIGLDKCIRFGKELSNYLNEALKDITVLYNVEHNTSEIRLSRIFSKVYLTEAKTKWVGYVVWEDDKTFEKPVMYAKGFEFKRGEVADISKKVQEDLFRFILDEKDNDIIQKYLIQKHIDLFNRQLDKMLYKKVTLTKDIESYKVEAQHVKAAKLLQAKGINITSGEKVLYIVGKNNRIIIDERNLTNTDYEHIWNHLVEPILERLDIKFENGVKQQDIQNYFE